MAKSDAPTTQEAIDLAIQHLATLVTAYKDERIAEGCPIPETVMKKRLLFALRANGAFDLRISISALDMTDPTSPPLPFAATEGRFEYLRNANAERRAAASQAEQAT